MICLNSTWNLINFRSGLIRALVSNGYDVIAVAPADAYAHHLDSLGCRYIALPMDSNGTHPGRDLLLLIRFFRLLLAEIPDVFLCYTVKPNVYGSLAAHALRIPVINNVAGLGTVFIKVGWLNQLVRALYRIAFFRSVKVFFQNDDDLQLFVSSGLVSKEIAGRLPGSGVDLAKFPPTALPVRSVVRFLLIARMLWDKGVGEYVEAARLLKKRGIEAECCLLGFLDVQNPSAISRNQMEDWMAEGVVRYLGVSDSVREEIALADCIVLPSFYREGTPRSLLEAAAMARPIVTTDSVGCRDVVDDGVNGYLCKPRDASDLAAKMERIVRMSPVEREIMGASGRKKIEREFDEQIVIKKYLFAIEALLAEKPSEKQIQRSDFGP
jgi:glycosyltransferase involved in cell wall biosynthesis